MRPSAASVGAMPSSAAREPGFGVKLVELGGGVDSRFELVGPRRRKASVSAVQNPVNLFLLALGERDDVVVERRPS